MQPICDLEVFYPFCQISFGNDVNTLAIVLNCLYEGTAELSICSICGNSVLRLGQYRSLFLCNKVKVAILLQFFFLCALIF